MDATALPPGTVIDRYTVEDVVGYGGMAVVWRVRHNDLGSLHALKVLQTRSPAVMERLVQEGRVQASLKHPNLVAVTDLVTLDGGDPGLIMEFVQGPSLRDLFDRGPLTLGQADALAKGILDGVAEAHRCGLVHRDLKPANILLEPESGTYRPKVADFGIAKVLDATVIEGQFKTRTGAAMGTPHYMAPEQVRDAANVGQAADIFALGVMLYELVTHERPFEGETTFFVFNNIVEGRYEPPEVHIPDLPQAMRAAIEAALKIEPGDRPASVEALAELWFADRPQPLASTRPFPDVERTTTRTTSRGWSPKPKPPPPPPPGWAQAPGGWGRTLALVAALIALGGTGLVIAGLYGVSQLLPTPETVADARLPKPEPAGVVAPEPAPPDEPAPPEEPPEPEPPAPKTPKPVAGPLPLETPADVERLVAAQGADAYGRLAAAVRTHPEPPVRAAAWSVLLAAYNAQAPGADEAVVGWMLAHGDRDDAVAAAKALGAHARSGRLLVGGLEHRLPRVRVATLEAVLPVHLRDPDFEFKPLVRPLAKDARNDRVRDTASEVLKDL